MGKIRSANKRWQNIEKLLAENKRLKEAKIDYNTQELLDTIKMQDKIIQSFTDRSCELYLNIRQTVTDQLRSFLADNINDDIKYGGVINSLQG